MRARVRKGGLRKPKIKGGRKPSKRGINKITMGKNGTKPLLILAASFLLLFAPLRPTTAGNQILDTLEKEMTKLVKGVQPSVVSVLAKCRTRRCNSAQATGSLKTPKPSTEKAYAWQTNVGSGFIMDARGYIMTAENVVRNAEEFEVTLFNGRKYFAQMIGSDLESNIAVLKIEGDDFTPAKMGDSNRLKVGSWVTIVGNSFGLSSAVSFGLVNGIREEDDLIQISAYVSPGNSGAAALNTRGEVIGLVAAAVTEPVTLTIGAPGGQELPQQRFDLRSQGASLAIPVHRAKTIAHELIEHGKYERSWLGVTIQDLTQDLAAKLKVPSGVFVTQVSEASPASEAGIQPGDVIVEYNGRKVTEGKILVDWVSSTHIGDVIPITVCRNGQNFSLITKISKRPTQVAERTDGRFMIIPEHHAVSGAEASPQQTTSTETMKKRIEQLEKDIRRLESLLEKKR